jgi:SNF2 family DNA or RNA helicase
MQAATNPELLRHSFNGAFDEDGNPIVESKEDSIFISNILQFVSNEMPNKFIKACEIVKDIISQGGKVVIWASFIRNIEKMSQCLSDMGIPSKSLYGVTPVETADDEFESQMETREFIVREFNSDNSSFNVIIANPSAVAESISLHKKCHNAIYLERSFNAAHFIQSKDRIHRYGLPEDTITTYYYLISENSIDETINSRLQLKEKRLNQIMESMPIPLFDNNLEEGGIDDIKAIIYDYAQRAKKI